MIPRPAPLLCIGLLLAGCGEEANRAQPREGHIAVRADELDANGLLALLARPHREVAGDLAPHRLRYRAVTTLGDGERRTEISDDVDVVARVRNGHTELALRQSNSEGRGRQMVVLDDTLYSRVLPRPFFKTPVESDIHEDVLDELFRAPHDLLAVAARQLQIESGPAEDGSIAVKVSLGAPREDAPSPPPWARDVNLQTLAGDLTVQAKTGVPTAFDLTLTFVVETAGGQQTGTMSLQGGVTWLESASIEAPPADEMATEPADRRRLVPAVRRALDGLAAPR